MKCVSVIIPCYNAEAYIDAAICSIYEQSYPNVELIVVNDGSTDQSEERILPWKARFADKDYKLIYLRQDNQGQAAATSLALKHVTGEYLTLLDADDIFFSSSIRKRVEFLDKHPEYAGVRTNGWYVSEENRWLFITSDEEKRITDVFSALIHGKTNNWAGSYMIRTSILFAFYQDRSIYPSRYGQNLQLLLPVSYCRLFGFIDEPLMEYYIRKNSHSHSSEDAYTKSEKNAYGYQDIYEHMLKIIVKNPTEHGQYQRIIDICFFRAGMIRAAHYNKIGRMKEYFIKLKKMNATTIDDRVVLYGKINPGIALFLRAVRKLVRLLGKGWAKC